MSFSSNMSKFRSRLNLLLTTSTLLVATAASSQVSFVETDAAIRIELASQLPTITQQVAAASCALTSNVDVEEAHDVLEHATLQFDRYIVALRDGNEELGVIGREENRRINVDIENILLEWQAIHGAIDTILVDGSDMESSHIIDDHNLKLLELTSALVSDISGTYSNPAEISAADAMVITLAGRQRMLTQKMAKDACEIWTGYNSVHAMEDLRETMVVFENSLTALRDGMPSVGVQAAPNDVIRADLDDLLGRWAVLKPNLQTLVEGGELDEAQKFEVFHDLEVELAALDHLLTDYREYAER